MAKKALNWLIKALIFLLIFLFLAYAFKTCRSFAYRVFSDSAKTAKESANVISAAVHISEGESLLSIGEDLEEKGIIRDRWSFAVALRCMDDYDKILAGDYTFYSYEKPSQILTDLLNGPPVVEESQEESQDSGTETQEASADSAASTQQEDANAGTQEEK